MTFPHDITGLFLGILMKIILRVIVYQESSYVILHIPEMGFGEWVLEFDILYMVDLIRLRIFWSVELIGRIGLGFEPNTIDKHES